MIAVGIDLGTTFSAVAYMKSDGKPYVIPNESGSLTTPSVVCAGPHGLIVGEDAKRLRINDAVDVATFFKRAMSNPNFALALGGRTYTAVELSAAVLTHMKSVAEAHLRKPVTHATVTVPAYFANRQRAATIEAAQLAGLELLSIINEPTAAAISYGFHPGRQPQTILVYDLGGGTFDVSIVAIDQTELRVVATDGDHCLGGKDWDDRLATLLAKQFEEEYGIDPLTYDPDQLLTQAEALKHRLSLDEFAEVEVAAEGYVGSYVVTRDEFARSTSDLLERTRALTEQALEERHLQWSDIDSILPIGGSTRMPMVHDLLYRMSGQNPATGVDPDLAVALGAAVRAAIDYEARVNGPAAPMLALPGARKIVDVMSHSLGMIAVHADGSRYVNSIVLEKNKPIPCHNTRSYELSVRPSRDNDWDVYLTQGESTEPGKCEYLGRYVFNGIPYVEGGIHTVDVTYRYDKDGVAQISACEHTSGRDLKVTVLPLPDDVPQRFLGAPVVQREPVTLYFAFDLSGSMAGRPLAEAQRAACSFVSQCDLTVTAIGLISFSNDVRVDAGASQNPGVIERAINDLSIGRTGIGNDAHPFDEILRRLKSVDGLRYAIVLTDGVWPYQETAVRAARTCRDAGINIIAIGFGGADRTFLEKIASSSAQSFFTDLGRLSDTFGSIAREIARSQGAVGLRTTAH